MRGLRAPRVRPGPCVALAFIAALAGHGLPEAGRALERAARHVRHDARRPHRLLRLRGAPARPPWTGWPPRACCFENAYSSIPLTAPSHSTMLTGKFPMAHGVRDNGLFVLAPEQQTLAEILKARGYRTAAAVGGFPLVARYGLEPGLRPLRRPAHARVRQPPRGRRRGRGTASSSTSARRRGSTSRCSNGWAPSGASPSSCGSTTTTRTSPSSPPVPYDQLFADRPYDGEIAYADESLGTLLDRLKRDGALRPHARRVHVGPRRGPAASTTS